jgi:hypothetical protein
MRFASLYSWVKVQYKNKKNLAPRVKGKEKTNGMGIQKQVWKNHQKMPGTTGVLV